MGAPEQQAVPVMLEFRLQCNVWFGDKTIYNHTAFIVAYSFAARFANFVSSQSLIINPFSKFFCCDVLGK